MMKCEFEEMVGKEVTEETYKIYEQMYTALPEGITKQQFVEMLDISAIPESDSAIKRREEAAKFRQEILNEIAGLQKEVKEVTADIERYKEFIELNDDDKDYWKSEARRYREYARKLKAKIATLKWIVA